MGDWQSRHFLCILLQSRHFRFNFKNPCTLIGPECQAFWLALIEWGAQLPWEMGPASLVKSYDWSKLGSDPVTVCTPRVSNFVPAWTEVSNTIWLVHSVGSQYDWMSEVGRKHVVVGPKHVVSLGPQINVIECRKLGRRLTIVSNTCNWDHWH